MSNSGEGRRGAGPFVAAGLLVLALAGGYLAFRATRGTAGAYQYQPAPATQQTRPTTGESSQAAPAPAPKPPTTTFVDVLRAHFPTYTTTQPLAVPVRELADAARIMLPDPVYLGQSNRADLWITRHDGLSTEAALKRAMDTKEYAQVHVLPERVRCVHWDPGPRQWTPFVVCDSKTSPSGLEVVSIGGRREPIAHDRGYDWARANSWNNRLVVPSARGVSIFRFEPQLTEYHRELLPPEAGDVAGAKPQALLDWQGLLAWAPADNGQRGSRGAARYVDDKWVDLGPEQGWPEQILQLVPLRDGSVIQLVVEPGGNVRIALAVLYNANVSEQAIATLVEQLSDPDTDKREAAFKELSQYGVGAFPVLEKLMPDQPPEARGRLRTLLRNQVQPTLGGMALIGDKVQTVTRHDDGGVIFYAPEGIAISREGNETVRRVPAWLSVRPGKAAEVLDEYLVRELKPESCTMTAIGAEWIVTSDAAGPKRWVGNDFVPLLAKDERSFTELVGIDRRGRWLLRKPKAESPRKPQTKPDTRPDTQPASGPASTSTGEAEADSESTSVETLILDPTLPDPTPKLPFWEFLTARAFGWDAEGWPVVRREGGEWALRESGWKLLNLEKGERMLTSMPDEPAGGAATSTQPTTSTVLTLKSNALPSEVYRAPTTQGERAYQGVEITPAGVQGRLLLTDRAGTRYYDGLTSIQVVTPDGRLTTWPLPAASTGKGPATLIQAHDGLLFLFNQPGRVLRIRPTPGEAEPFTIEAVFTRKIPSVTKPKRIWLDPAGRIVVVDARRVVLFFPQGFIPPPIRDLMPVDRSDARQE